MSFIISVFLPFKKIFNRISRRVAPEVLEPRPVSSESITETMRRQTEPRPIRSESRRETMRRQTEPRPIRSESRRETMRTEIEIENRKKELEKLYKSEYKKLTDEEEKSLKNLKNGILFHFFGVDEPVDSILEKLFTTLRDVLPDTTDIALLMECKELDEYYKEVKRIVEDTNHNKKKLKEAFNQFINWSLYFNILLLKIITSHSNREKFVMILSKKIAEENITKEQERKRLAAEWRASLDANPEAKERLTAEDKKRLEKEEQEEQKERLQPLTREKKVEKEIKVIYKNIQPYFSQIDEYKQTKKYNKYLLEKRDFNEIQQGKIKLRQYDNETQLYRDLHENLQLNLANYEQNYGKKFKASILDDLYDYKEFLAKELQDRYKSPIEKQRLNRIYIPIIEELEILVEEQYGRIVGGNKKIIKKLKKYK